VSDTNPILPAEEVEAFLHKAAAAFLHKAAAAFRPESMAYAAILELHASHEALRAALDAALREKDEAERERDEWRDAAVYENGEKLAAFKERNRAVLDLAAMREALRSDAAIEAACCAYIPRWNDYSGWRREQWRADMRRAFAAGLERAEQIAGHPDFRATLTLPAPEGERT
jgi:hypothetical protein